MEKKKLAIVSHACVRSINRSIYALLESLGWNIELVVPSVWKSGKTQLQLEPWQAGEPRLVPLNVAGENLRTFHFEGLTSFLDDSRPDIVFLECDPVSRLAIVAGRWCRKNRAPLACLTCENLPFDFWASVRRGGFRSVPFSLAKTFLCSQSKPLQSHVFTTSQDGVDIFHGLGFSSVSQIPLGYDPRYFFANEDARLRIRSLLKVDGPVFAYFGRLVPEKGVHLLLDALSKMLDVDWSLILNRFNVTDANYSRLIEKRLGESGLGSRVRFAESAHGAIADYMNAADVVVIPSIATAKWKEQYGRVAPEAMACGKTVVAFRSGALTDLVSSYGLLVDEGDVEGLAAVLRELAIGEIPLGRYSQPAAVYARENLSIHSQAKKMHDTFLRLLARPR